MHAFDEQIEQGRGRIHGLINKKKETLDGGKVQGSSVTYKEFIKAKIDDLKALRDKKAKLNDDQKRIQERIEKLEHERSQLLKNLPERRDDQDPNKIKQNIDDMNKRYETTTLSPADEKKLLATIKKLKEQIPNAERLQELNPLFKQLNEQKKPIYEEIKAIKAQIDLKSKELDDVRKEQTDIKEKNNDLTEQLNKLNE